MSCRRSRGVMFDVVRGAATEADRLRLEHHLDGCAACRRERAAWALMERARELPPRRLGAPARARVLARLVAAAAEGGAKGAGEPLHEEVLGAREAQRTSRARLRLGALGAVAVAASLALAVLAQRTPGGAPALVAAATDGRVLGGGAGTEVAIAGARIGYRSASRVRLTASRRLDLVAGRIDVEVTPGGPGRFRVYTPRFIVEVLGTRFVVDESGVATSHGRVRVLDLAEREVAVVSAGEAWSLPALPVAAAAPPVGSAVPSPPPQVAAPALAPAAPAPTAAASVHGRPDVATLLRAARSALADRRYPETRALLGQVLELDPPPRERAVAELYGADLLRVEGHLADAALALRRVAYRFDELPEGELAAFQLATLAFEGRVRTAPGAAAPFATTEPAREPLQEIDRYLGRYPNGRFVDEARAMRSRLAGPATR